MGQRSLITCAALTALLALVTPGNGAFGQERGRLRDEASGAPEAIIVTARKIRERSVDVPLSLSVIGREEIDTFGLKKTSDLLALAPNVDMSGGIAGSLQGQLSIRGISTLVRNIGLESGVSIFVDDVYIGRPDNFHFDLLNVDSVEILRGPQGTEFGKNTIAGIIHIKTAEPSDEPAASLTLETGNYDRFQGRFRVNAPLSEHSSANLSLGYSRHDGYYRHLSGGKDAGDANLLSWQGAFKLAPSETARFVFRLDGLRERKVPGYFQARDLAGFPEGFPSSQPLRINNNRPNALDRNVLGISLTADFAWSGLDITSISAFRTSSYDASLDDDQEQVDFISADLFAEDSELYSQELRASGSTGSLGYLLGLYFLQQDVRSDRTLALGSDLGFASEPALLTIGKVNTKSYAAFARIDTSIFNKLNLSAGVRYTREDKTASLTQVDQTGILSALGFPDLQFNRRTSDSFWQPTFSLQVPLSVDANIYARFARGSKSAAFNIDLATSIDHLVAGPERATSLEAGLKGDFFDRRLRLNMAVFHVTYDDLQVSQLLGGGISLSNAGKARAIGAEVEGQLRVSENLKFHFAAGLLDAEYRRFPSCGVPLSLGGGTADCSGNRLVVAPRFTAFGGAELSVPVRAGKIFATANVNYRSSVFFEPTNSERFLGRARALIDLRFGISRPAWDLAFWMRNLTNERYETYMDDRSAIGVLRTTAYGTPRTYGITLSGRL